MSSDSASPPVLGREKEIRRVVELLATGKHVAIVGPYGSGKTTIAREVLSLLSGQGSAIFRIDLANDSSPIAAVEAACRGGNGTVMALDQADAIGAFSPAQRSRLVELLSSSGATAVFCAGDWDRVQQQLLSDGHTAFAGAVEALQLGALPKDAAIALLSWAAPNAPLEDVIRLAGSSWRNPRLLRRLAASLRGAGDNLRTLADERVVDLLPGLRADAERLLARSASASVVQVSVADVDRELLARAMGSLASREGRVLCTAPVDGSAKRTRLGRLLCDFADEEARLAAPVGELLGQDGWAKMDGFVAALTAQLHRTASPVLFIIEAPFVGPWNSSTLPDFGSVESDLAELLQLANAAGSVRVALLSNQSSLVDDLSGWATRPAKIAPPRQERAVGNYQGDPYDVSAIMSERRGFPDGPPWIVAMGPDAYQRQLREVASTGLFADIAAVFDSLGAGAAATTTKPDGPIFDSLRWRFWRGDNAAAAGAALRSWLPIASALHQGSSVAAFARSVGLLRSPRPEETLALLVTLEARGPAAFSAEWIAAAPNASKALKLSGYPEAVEALSAQSEPMRGPLEQVLRVVLEILGPNLLAFVDDKMPKAKGTATHRLSEWAVERRWAEWLAADLVEYVTKPQMAARLLALGITPAPTDSLADLTRLALQAESGCPVLPAPSSARDRLRDLKAHLQEAPANVSAEAVCRSVEAACMDIIVAYGVALPAYRRLLVKKLELTNGDLPSFIAGVNGAALARLISCLGTLVTRVANGGEWDSDFRAVHSGEAPAWAPMHDALDSLRTSRNDTLHGRSSTGGGDLGDDAGVRSAFLRACETGFERLLPPVVQVVGLRRDAWGTHVEVVGLQGATPADHTGRTAVAYCVEVADHGIGTVFYLLSPTNPMPVQPRLISVRSSSRTTNRPPADEKAKSLLNAG